MTNGSRLSTGGTRAGVLLGLGFALAACDVQVTVDDDEEECGPRPPSEGWCPPQWECVDGEWVSLDGVCLEPECPAVKPADGDACERVGQSCLYSEEIDCGPFAEVTAECTDEGWRILTNYCQPEPTCPDTMPAVGSDCSDWEYPYYCPYTVACEGAAVSVAMSCDYTTPTPTWKVDGDAPACGSCEAATDPLSCGANVGCTWRVPGCAFEGETPIVEGCYPALDCNNAESCPDPGHQCQTFIVDLCVDVECDACGTPIGVCVTP
jgi:hypothetical protein